MIVFCCLLVVTAVELVWYCNVLAKKKNNSRLQHYDCGRLQKCIGQGVASRGSVQLQQNVALRMAVKLTFFDCCSAGSVPSVSRNWQPSLQTWQDSRIVCRAPRYDGVSCGPHVAHFFFVYYMCAGAHCQSESCAFVNVIKILFFAFISHFCMPTSVFDAIKLFSERCDVNAISRRQQQQQHHYPINQPPNVHCTRKCAYNCCLLQIHIYYFNFGFFFSK